MREISTRTAVIIPCLAAPIGIAYLAGRGMSIAHASVIALCGGAALAGMLVLGSDRRLEDLQQWLQSRAARVFAIVAALWGLYVVYAIGTGIAQLRTVLFMAAYLALPFASLARDRGVSRGTWLDAFTILWLWLPIELGIVRRMLLTAAPNMDFHYAFAQGLAINTGIAAFAGWRRLPGIGYRFSFDRKAVSLALWSFLLFAVIAVPLGFAIHFIRYSFEWRKLIVAPAAFAGIFMFTAIPEEFLFRGLIQNWLERVMERRNLTLVIASIIFGASHLNNGPPIPNYRYFLMASIAGIFYGYTWRRSGSLAASAVTHALVDTVWSVFFR